MLQLASTHPLVSLVLPISWALEIKRSVLLGLTYKPKLGGKASISCVTNETSLHISLVNRTV